MDFVNDTLMTSDTAVSPRHHEVLLLAFKLWQERGAPLGTPEVDWFRAEKELANSDNNADSALLTLAQTIGSALGSVASLVSTKP